MHNSSNICYDDAISLLQREYGNPLRISCAYMEKLKNWPVVKNGDALGFMGLYRFLLQCHAYQKNGLDWMSGLDSPLMICNIQLELPVNVQDNWTRLVSKIRKKERREANFVDFVEFIEAESAVLNDPIYSHGVSGGGGGGSVKGNHMLEVNSTTKPSSLFILERISETW